MSLIFLAYIGVTAIIVIVGSIIHDLIVEGAEITYLRVNGTPPVVHGDNIWTLNVYFRCKDTHWFWGKRFGPRRGITWRIHIKPEDPALVDVKPRLVEQGASNRSVFVVQKAFYHKWDAPDGVHFSEVTIFLNNKEVHKEETQVYVKN